MPSSSHEAPAQRVTLARILRARGRKGEVAAQILTDFPARLSALREVWLWNGKTQPRPARIHTCWLHQDHVVFHFLGCDSISEAEKLRGLEVQVPLSERVVLPQGRYYVTDLIGCEVFDCSPGHQPDTPLGSVRDVQPIGEATPGTPLLAVETKRGELLIPLAEEICRRIDVAARRIEVVLPEGLRDLN